jgi:hypothetical protein
MLLQCLGKWKKMAVLILGNVSENVLIFGNVSESNLIYIFLPKNNMMFH